MRIQCNASIGLPHPTVSWKFTSLLTGKETVLDHQTGDLRLTAIRDNAGTYSCLVLNELGSELY